MSYSPLAMPALGSTNRNFYEDREALSVDPRLLTGTDQTEATKKVY